MIPAVLSQLTLLGLAAADCILVKAFYRAFESRWPENYFGGEGGIDPVISRTPWRYAIFRLLPVAACLSVAGTVSARLGYSRTLAVVYTAALYIAGGPGRGCVEAWRAGRVGLTIYRLATIFGCIVVAVLTSSFGEHVDNYIPEAQQLAEAVWTGLAVLALAQLALSLTGRSLKPAELVIRARSGISPRLLDAIRSSGLADSDAVEAIALAEELNRPAWARRLERILVPRSGTYGLMQVRAERPLGDLASVEHYLSRLRASQEFPAIEDDGRDLRSFFLSHNDDSNFADLATRLYWEIRKERLQSPSVDPPSGTTDQQQLAQRVGTVLAGIGLIAAGTSMIIRRRKAAAAAVAARAAES